MFGLFSNCKKIKQLEARVLELSAQNAELTRRCKIQEHQLETADVIMADQRKLITNLSQTLTEERSRKKRFPSWMQKYSPSHDPLSLN
jgi:chromosome segregation ATPase